MQKIRFDIETFTMLGWLPRFWFNISQKKAMGTVLNTFKKIIPSSLKRKLKLMLGRDESTPREEPAQSVAGLGLREKFSEVYTRNIFEGSESRSGNGSDLHQTRIIRREIPKLLQELNVKSLIDAPCGDWYWIQQANLPIKEYIGIDIVEALIQKNQASFGNDQVRFECANLAETQLPKADLILSRDCLVHLSFEDALKIISNFKRSGAKYLLTTSFVGRKENPDLGQGFWRPLNLQLAPFNFPSALQLINEECTEGNNKFTDKCLGLWLLEGIHVAE